MKSMSKIFLGTGSAVTGSISGAIVGEILIPIPVVGALIGGFVGGFIGSKASNVIFKLIDNKHFTNLCKKLEEKFYEKNAKFW